MSKKETDHVVGRFYPVATRNSNRPNPWPLFTARSDSSGYWTSLIVRETETLSFSRQEFKRSTIQSTSTEVLSSGPRGPHPDLQVSDSNVFQ